MPYANETETFAPGDAFKPVPTIILLPFAMLGPSGDPLVA